MLAIARVSESQLYSIPQIERLNKVFKFNKPIPVRQTRLQQLDQALIDYRLSQLLGDALDPMVEESEIEKELVASMCQPGWMQVSQLSIVFIVSKPWFDRWTAYAKRRYNIMAQVFSPLSAK